MIKVDLTLKNGVQNLKNVIRLKKGYNKACSKVWDCRSKSQEPVQTMEECGDNVTSLDVSDHEILVGSGDSHVRRYDMRNGQLVTDFMGATVASVRFTRDGQCLLVGCVASTVKLVDKATGEMLQVGRYNVVALLYGATKI